MHKNYLYIMYMHINKEIFLLKQLVKCDMYVYIRYIPYIYKLYKYISNFNLILYI